MDTNFENNAELMDLYSRQIGTFGIETMRSLLSLDVLIIGCSAAGCEAAKNVCLAGPRSITLVDSAVVVPADLGANCFLRVEDVAAKKTRAQAALPNIAVLNPLVSVKVVEAPVSAELATRYGVVIVADSSLGYSKLAEIDNACHAKNIPFIMAGNYGVTGMVFTDFGAKHVITDSNGEAAIVNVIQDMEITTTPENVSVQITVAAHNHNLDDDKEVKIESIEGAGFEALNGETVKVKRVYIKYDGGRRERLIPKKLDFVLTAEQQAKLRAAGPEYNYIRGGFATEAKPRIEKSYLTLAEAMVNPPTEMFMPFVKHFNQELLFCGRGSQDHYAVHALLKFIDKHGALPRLHNAEDAAECVAIAKELAKAAAAAPEGTALVLEEIDESIVRNTALYARAELPGFSTFLGGVIAQEVVKKFGKYTPLEQFLYMDYMNILPKDGSLPKDCEPTGTRYDHQIAVIGREAHEKIINQRVFLVGAGALGCEYLKGFALMGIGAGKDGDVQVTDMDRIEVSNLNRQFLFRRENVHQSKSAVAGAAVMAMNPDIKVTSLEAKMCPETEDKFNDKWWSKLDFVCNALDNVIARKYMDSRCVFFEKPLFESGTLGTQANSEVILPHQTVSYSENSDGGDGTVADSIPMCTLKSFPYLIEHCIEWSRNAFTDMFEGPAQEAANFVKCKADFLATLKKEGGTTAQFNKLMGVKTILAAAGAARSFHTCIQLALDDFQTRFHSEICTLCHTFPEDHTTKDPDTGKVEPFWSGTKRFPRPTSFNAAEELHLQYVFACANLYAYMFGLPAVRDMEEFKKILANETFDLKMWSAETSAKAKGDTDDDADAEDNTKSEADVENVIAEIDEIVAKAGNMFVPVPAEFEKDDDTNFHIDFITAAANMRGWNYHIGSTSRHQCKMIAGKIIPAIATTTAMITGVNCMEMYKLALGLKKADFVNAQVNLAINSFELFEPENPIKQKKHLDIILQDEVTPVPDGFTIWDKTIIKVGNITVDEFVKRFPDIHHGCVMTGLYKAGLAASEATLPPIYTDFPMGKKGKEMAKELGKMTVADAYQRLYGSLPDRDFLLLEGDFETADGEPAIIPKIFFYYK